MRGLELLALGGIIYSVLRPHSIFNAVDRVLPETKEVDELAKDHVWNSLDEDKEDFFEDFRLDRDTQRLAALDEMVRTATTRDVKRIWTVKRDQFVRNLKWRMMEESAGMSSRQQKEHMVMG